MESAWGMELDYGRLRRSMTGVDGEIVWLLSKRSDIIMEKFTALNRAQRLAIREFLIHVMDEPDHQDYRDEIEIALETAWADDM